MADDLYFNAVQLKYELSKCLSCKSKPCTLACPVSCCPQEFIAKAKEGDFAGAIEAIRSKNPMGQTCGLICPDTFCMKACVRGKIDAPVNIPKVQATIMHSHAAACEPVSITGNGRKVAVIGAGPAGFAAVNVLAGLGYTVDVFDADSKIGGALNMIPESRLPRDVIERDWGCIAGYNNITLHLKTAVEDENELLNKGYDGVIVATGEPETVDLNVVGEEYVLSHIEYLKNPKKYITDGNVAVIGGGNVAVDCAIVACENGATNVEMFVRRRLGDMRITARERNHLLEHNVDITTMTRICGVEKVGDTLTLATCKTRFNDGRLEDIPNTVIKIPGFKYAVKAIGSRSERKTDTDKIIYAGDCRNGSSTIVQALSSGQKAAFLLHKSIAEQDLYDSNEGV